jgi:hypothetical protein
MMKATIATLFAVMILGWIGSGMPGRAVNPLVPQETLFGLKPGESTVADAVRILGRYDVKMPGSVAFIAGGERFTLEYRWNHDIATTERGLAVSTSQGSTRINLILVDTYPGITTGRGLGALTSENEALVIYGLPDFAFAWHFGDKQACELFYLREGLILGLTQIPGRPNWTVTKIILTFPTYLRNAISQRTIMAITDPGHVEDITYRYRVWARLAIPPG